MGTATRLAMLMAGCAWAAVGCASSEDLTNLRQEVLPAVTAQKSKQEQQGQKLSQLAEQVEALKAQSKADSEATKNLVGERHRHFVATLREFQETLEKVKKDVERLAQEIQTTLERVQEETKTTREAVKQQSEERERQLAQDVKVIQEALAMSITRTQALTGMSSDLLSAVRTVSGGFREFLKSEEFQLEARMQVVQSLLKSMTGDQQPPEGEAAISVKQSGESRSAVSSPSRVVQDLLNAEEVELRDRLVRVRSQINALSDDEKPMEKNPE